LWWNTSISDNGRFVAFISDATNLVTGDTNNKPDVFVHDMQTGDTTRVSVASDETEQNGIISYVPILSADGNIVLFTSDANNLVSGDTNSAYDVFIRNRQTNQTTRVSLDTSNLQISSASSGNDLSSDGRFAVFSNSSGVFVRDTQTNTTSRVFDQSSERPSISGDGSFVSYDTASGSPSNFSNIYLYNRQTSQSTRISKTSDGSFPNERSIWSKLSQDGGTIVFEALASDLVSGDTNTRYDIFTADRLTGTIKRVSVQTNGSELSAGSEAPDISADGRYVAFQSFASNLTAGDTNNIDDIFIVRLAPFTAPATFVVNSTADPGDGVCNATECTLREAINAANATANTDTLQFNIPGTGAHTIQPTSPLPTITNPVIMDGTTQPGYSGTPLIVLDGTNAGVANGLTITAGNSTVRALAIRHFNTGSVNPQKGADLVLQTGGNNVAEANVFGITSSQAGFLNFDRVGVEIIDSANNRIGGSTNGSGNTTYQWINRAIDIRGSSAGNNVVIGNNLQSADTGVMIRGNAHDNRIGGADSGEGNTITTPAYAAVMIGYLNDPGTTNNRVVGNNIHDSYYGVAVGISNNQIGGTAPGEGNVLIDNFIAVYIGSALTPQTDTTGISILGNQIKNRLYGGYPSIQLGIDLNQNGVTLNDAGDTDTGMNLSQNFPVLSAAQYGGGNLAISGTLNSNANKSYRVEFFDNAACHSSGYGQGETYLGYTNVTTNGSGNASLSVTLPVSITAGHVITATATDPQGNTSEFSACRSVVVVASTIMVNSTADPGNGVCDATECTLREALTDANLFADTNTITFNIPGTGVHSIQPATQLPTITNPVIIDGTTQPGYAGTPLIELRGADGSFTPANGLVITAGGSTVKGLAVNRFGDSGITISGAGGNTITASFIGTNPDGSTAPGGGFLGGILIDNASNNVIGGTGAGDGNLISGNNNGVVIQGANASGNQVMGNRIGTNAAGTAALPNVNDGILIRNSAHDNVIGGTSVGAGNLISGNSRSGILLAVNATANRIEGNFIGTDITGTAALANGTAASGTTNNNGVETDATASGNTIGGTNGAAQNVISGNAKTGVWLNSQNNTVRGNLIGVNKDGAAALPNQEFGITTMGGSNSLIGNVISGNGQGGISLYSNNNTVQGNFIGTDATGTLNLKNTVAGIDVGGSSNTIGGTSAGQANIIAFNGNNSSAPGIGVQTSAVGNRINGNRIFSNAGLGIDLLPGGVTANDTGDADNGANKLQNFPVLSAAQFWSGSLNISGTFNSSASQSYRIEFFDNTACHSSGYGQGETYLGFTNVTTNGTGNATINTSIPANIPAGHAITATATDPQGNTSEFSACQNVTIQPPATITVNSAADPGNGVCDATECTLREAITDANLLPDTNTITFNITADNKTIQPVTPLPQLNTPMIIDGTTQPGYNGKPLIVLDGAATQPQLPANGQGQHIDLIGINMVGCTGCVVRGLNIRNFGYGGVGILNGGSNVVQGNTIGTDATGTTAAPNLYGVIITNSNGNQIGGQTAGLGNVISGNDNDGVNIYGSSFNNHIEGNRIGTNAAGTALLGNKDKGIKIELSSNTLISGNTIAGNGNPITGKTAGVYIKAAGTGNNLVNNRIYSNVGLGIDLTASGQQIDPPDGVTPNDLGDGDGGPNNLQNYPVLTSAFVDASGITIYGTLNSATFADFQLEFFASPTCDPSGNGEGQTVLASRSVTTDETGNVAFTFVLNTAVPKGQFITATATDINGSTSEFSKCIPAQAIDFSQAPARNYFTTPHEVTLTWSRVTWAQSYEVQIATDKAFTHIVKDQVVNDGNTTYTWTDLDNGTYYWRVQAKNAQGGVSSWSAVDSFMVDVP
jgi:CSLREA domain-containing protein